MNSIAGLLKLTHGQKMALRRNFSESNPFGPSSARDIERESDVQELMFNTQNDIWREYQTGTRLIVGRRGAGKTTILRRTSSTSHFYVVHRIPLAEYMEEVRDLIFDDPQDYRKISAEITSKKWDRIVNVSLMSRVIAEDHNYQFARIKKYLSSIGVATDSPLKDRLNNLRKLSVDATNTVVSLAVNAALLVLNEFSTEYEDALLELDEYLTEKNRKVVAIIDNIEEYHVDDHQVKMVVKGLLKCVGDFGNGLRQIRLCIPAEVWFETREISSSITKDFSDTMVLHWSPIELLRIAAWRYLVGLAAYDSPEIKKFLDVDLNNRDHIHRVIANFLPKEILNRGGKKEITVVYLLRHTQLLPRQFILLLNTAFAGGGVPGNFNVKEVEEGLINAVQEFEQNVCEQVYNAFNFKYPFAKNLCKRIVPNLPRFFTEKDLEAVFRAKGKKVLIENRHVVEPDIEDFKEILFELGVLGRVKGKSTVYADAEFEYAMPGRLVVSRRDEICLHPAFSGAYETVENRDSEHYVYPHMAMYNNDAPRNLKLKVG
ncbi:MAG: P-loop ATPase, Sll1717 family [Sulfitobacter sp.]